MSSWEESGDLSRLVLRLEAGRVVAAASVGRVPGVSPETVTAIEEDIDRIMAGLARRNAAVPLHLVAKRYGLSGGEYAILHIALMPFHAQDLLDSLARALGGDDNAPRLSYALQVLAPSIDDYLGLRQTLIEMPLCTEQLITLVELLDGDARLQASPAILELLGLPKEL